MLLAANRQSEIEIAKVAASKSMTPFSNRGSFLFPTGCKTYRPEGQKEQNAQ